MLSCWPEHISSFQRPHRNHILLTPPAIGFRSFTVRQLCVAARGSKVARASSSQAMETSTTAHVLWFRRDLRLADNPTLLEACKGTYLIPVYILDPSEFNARLQPTSHSQQDVAQQRTENLLPVPKLGPWRCKFLLEALHSLRADLRAHGSELLFRIGSPHKELPHLLRHISASHQIQHITLHHSCDLLSESVALETAVQRGCEEACRQQGVSLSIQRTWSHTLYNSEDLPYEHFAKAAGITNAKDLATPKARLKTTSSDCITRTPDSLKHLPATMTEFRKLLGSAGTKVRELLPAPSTLPPLPPNLLTSHQHNSQQCDHKIASDNNMQTDITVSQETSTTQPINHHQEPQTDDIQGSNSSQCGCSAGEIPESVHEAYKQAGMLHMLHSLQEVVGVDYDALDKTQLQCSGPVYPRSAFQLHGGEQAALQRLRQYVWGRTDRGAEGGAPQQPPSLTYFTNTRAQAVGDLSSTKLSAYLGLGCISPRTVWWEVAAVHKAAQAAGSLETACDWLGLHLQIRDYYIFTAIKAGDALMTEAGIQGKPVSWRRDMQLFSRWAAGKTGFPFVDACMRELAGSGWMSNRGRQNVASLLTKELGLDWRLGAQLFESLLLDHDVAVNYCNWNYFAGTGTDPRNRRFKTVTQGMQYDEDAQLATAWLPELSALPTMYRHQPWLMTDDEKSLFGYVSGSTYPEPVLDPATQTSALPADGNNTAAAKQRAKKQAKATAALSNTIAGIMT